MRACHCQEHQSYRSVYCMLNLNETASAAELQHAYEAEMTVLDQMQPSSETERKLLTAKRQELSEAMERSKEETLSQRVQAQYETRKESSVKLHSVFPVGLLGLLLRLINVTAGTGGCCDNCFMGIFEWCDRDCCGCSCCHDGTCCFTELYASVFSNCICSFPSKAANCYEDAFVVRVVDMGLVILAVVGAIICYIQGVISAAEQRRQRAKKLGEATKMLREMRELLNKRDDMVHDFVKRYEEFKLFTLDVRPFVKFIATLPGTSDTFAAMAGRIEQPGSFYDKLGVELVEMRKIHSRIVEINKQIVPIAEKIQGVHNEYRELEEREHCSERLNSALHGLENNNNYQQAVTFIRRQG